MRSRLAPFACVFLACALGSRAVWADPPVAAEAPGATATDAARAHFKTGIKLYQDQNYAGALAEFEAAYALKPGPGSLQNVALCQKALFRYGEAADSLDRLLTRHGAELSPDERTAAETAKAELEALVGVVRVQVSPPTAAVTLDGRPFAVDPSGTTARLNVGEHLFAASAPGYTRITRTLTVASGQAQVNVLLELVATSGFLDITAADAKQGIAIDGTPVAYGRFHGPVTPGDEHLVQIYDGATVLLEERVKVELGKTFTVAPRGTPGVPAGAASDKTANAAEKPKQLGWYGMGSVSLLASTTPPFRFDLSDARSRAWGFGLRGGRRFKAPVAIAGLVEYTTLNVSGACDTRRGELAMPPIVCGTPEADALEVSYSVHSVRFGPVLELMTTDPRLRAIGGLGLGLVWHQLTCTGCIADTEQKSSGTDASFLMELGVSANTRHVLMALALRTLIDGTAGMIPSRNLGTDTVPVRETAYDKSGRALAYVGLELRLGMSEWAP
ncbi:MAG TPA: hypothetical protein VNN72_08850 [Polyangiaceae bacterium]|nr:hypothetical protein [Polyangiaceae bacterium]